MKVDPLWNYLLSFRPILHASTTKNATETNYYYYLKSRSRPRPCERVPGSDCSNDYVCLPASRPMAGPRRCVLINADRHRSWDSASNHRILKGDILDEAMRLVGIGAAEDGAEDEGLDDLRLSGLSDLSLPGEMEGWDLDDVLRTPPPPFRPPPSPDQSEDDTEEEQDDSDHDNEDDRSESQRDSENDTSLSAEDSQNNSHDTSLHSESGGESTERDTETDKSSLTQDSQADDHSDNDNDEDQQDEGSGPQIGAGPRVGAGHAYDQAFRPKYVHNQMNNQDFCDLCQVPERFQTWITRGVPVFINRTFSRKMRGRMCREEEIQAQAHINALCNAELIEKCSRGNFVSLPNVVPKGTASSCLVIDYSHLTDYMEKTPFYLPSVYSVVFEKLPAVTKEQYMIKIDLTAAFYHIALRPEAKHVTTFR